MAQSRALTDVSRRVRMATFGVVGLGVFVNLLVLAAPIYSMQVFDRVLASGRVETLVLLTAILVIALAVHGLLEALRSVLLTRMGGWVEDTLDGPALDAVQASARGGGQPLQDLRTVRGFLAGPAATGLFDAPWFLAFAGVLALLHPLIGLMAVGAALIMGAITTISLLATRKSRDASQGQAVAARLADAAQDGAATWRALGMTDTVIERVRQVRARAGLVRDQAAERDQGLKGGSKFVRQAAQSGVLGLAAYLVLTGALTPGAMLAASILMGRALGVVDGLGVGLRGAGEARAAWGRLKQVLATPVPGPERLPAAAGPLSVEEVSVLRPGGARPLLFRVAFKADPGELVVVTGASGSGKTLLAEVLAGGRAPDHGRVRLDGIEVAQRAGGTGYAGQKPVFLPGTIAQNIARFRRVESAAVIAAARSAGLHEAVAALPQGYDTPIDGDGAPLSPGQRRRLALARALYGQPRLVILDEPEADLDHQGRAALMGALAELRRQGIVVVVITAAGGSAYGANRTVVLQDGRAQVQETARTAKPARLKVAAE